MGFERTVHSGVATTSIALGQLEDINPALSAAASPSVAASSCAAEQTGRRQGVSNGGTRAAGQTTAVGQLTILSGLLLALDAQATMDVARTGEDE